MRDCPYSADTDPSYVEHVLTPLAKGEGVACFVADSAMGERSVLFFTHTLSGAAATYATDTRDEVRAAQAVAVQRAARSRAEAEGFHATVA
jgi:hypothetical protein